MLAHSFSGGQNEITSTSSISPCAKEIIFYAKGKVNKKISPVNPGGINPGNSIK